MASKLISSNDANDAFNLGAQVVTDKDLRHAVADALRKSRWSNGPEIVEFLYVQGDRAVRQPDAPTSVDANGWFWDSFDLCTNDHEFDWNRITPGAHWGYAQELKEQEPVRTWTPRLGSRKRARRPWRATRVAWPDRPSTAPTGSSRPVSGSFRSRVSLGMMPLQLGKTGCSC